uniref:Uncharacterized protein n=1 Tax=Macrostomum lignano TaxID=282301 RepID=A0A1I8FGM1_9PLAT
MKHRSGGAAGHKRADRLLGPRRPAGAQAAPAPAGIQESRRVDGGGTGGSGSSSGGLRQVGQWKPETTSCWCRPCWRCTTSAPSTAASASAAPLRRVRAARALARPAVRPDTVRPGPSRRPAPCLPHADSCCAVGRRSPTLRRTCWPR